MTDVIRTAETDDDKSVELLRMDHTPFQYPERERDLSPPAQKGSEGPSSCTCDENDMYCPHTSSEGDPR